MTFDPPRHYVLIGQSPVLEPDFMAWAAWFETAERLVGYTSVGDLEISTVFLGLDHAFGGGPPLVFETMVFTNGSRLVDFDGTRRYSTWPDAEAGHIAMVHMVEDRTGQKAVNLIPSVDLSDYPR